MDDFWVTYEGIYVDMQVILKMMRRKEKGLLFSQMERSSEGTSDVIWCRVKVDFSLLKAGWSMEYGTRIN